MLGVRNFILGNIIVRRHSIDHGIVTVGGIALGERLPIEKVVIEILFNLRIQFLRVASDLLPVEVQLAGNLIHFLAGFQLRCDIVHLGAALHQNMGNVEIAIVDVHSATFRDHVVALHFERVSHGSANHTPSGGIGGHSSDFVQLFVSFLLIVPKCGD
ncbi:MAG: hypothetical protein DMG80_09465 [Acidobacteria bacterium]|nr:MAG: hypothetical protein DMG80_09465 [Acidobacteriota bacterium]